ncbi:hypothetical protein Catovirus_1_199 [Catovirus CTV1]|uniref:Uncharacterized protein n=1 Tax=Catovirus CTV1 TaxID=1977631 RepID=A0A1V0S8W6_9VIRU|nr:hypothetical protein Catovirus_1_199 [Catovirus CTV1]
MVRLAHCLYGFQINYRLINKKKIIKELSITETKYINNDEIDIDFLEMLSDYGLDIKVVSPYNPNGNNEDLDDCEIYLNIYSANQMNPLKLSEYYNNENIQQYRDKLKLLGQNYENKIPLIYGVN